MSKLELYFERSSAFREPAEPKMDVIVREYKEKKKKEKEKKSNGQQA